MTTHITKTWFDGEKVMTQEIPESDIYADDAATNRYLQLSALPNALRLAAALEETMQSPLHATAADCLRKMHAEIEAVMQAITDPENQPSQFGTVTVGYMQREVEAERQEIVVEFLKRHEGVSHHNNYWHHAANYVRERGEQK